MHRGHPPGGIGGIIQKPRFSVSSDDRIDLGSRLLGSLRSMPPCPTDQNPPQILGRAGIAPEIGERPAFEKLGSDLATIHLAAPSRVRDRLWSRGNIMKSRTDTHPGSAQENRRRILIPLVIGCAFFMEGLDSTMIAVAIPDMARSLGANPLRLNLVITTYLLSLAVFIPLSGWIADRLGARIVFCVAIAIFAAGSALCGLSTSLPMLLVMRVVQGFGGAMMTPVGRLILLRSFPRSGLVSAMNWMTIPAMIGPTVGPIVGGFLTTYFSWRAIFYLNVPIGIMGVVLALYLIENFRAPAPTAFDLRGFVLAGVGLAFLQLAIENLGRPLIPLLLNRGHQVRALARSGSERRVGSGRHVDAARAGNRPDGSAGS